ncbi:ATP-binding protein [Acidovorax delafieldii]|nr:ATP-binding protein [Acidovorax delafieldii]
MKNHSPDPFSFLNMASRRVLAGGLLLVLAVLVATGSLMWMELRRAQAQDRQQLELLASVMDAHATQLFDNTKVALDSLAKNLTHEAISPAQLEAQQSYRLQGLPFLRSIAALDIQGRVLASSAPSDRGGKVDLARLPAAPATDDRVVIGPWVNGRTLVADPRRGAVPARLGFIPMVRLVHLSPTTSVLLVAQINPDALANYQQQLTNGTSGGTQVLLALDSGTLLTQVGGETPAAGTRLRDHPVFQGLLPTHKGTYGPVRIFDARKLGAWHTSSSQPLVTLVEQPYHATLERWLASLRGPLLFMSVALALIGFMTYASWRSARAREAAERGRNEAQQETARREQELSVLFKSVQELIFRTDPHGRIRFVNARWHTITHQPVETARGKHLRDIVHPESRACVDALFAPEPPTGVRMAQVQLTGPDGGPRALDISVVPLRDPTGQLRGFAGSAVDVTPLLTAQQRLQEQLAFTSQVLECNPLPICMTDPEGRFLSVNQAWEDFMGVPRASVLGLRNSDFLAPQEARTYDASNDQLLREGSRVRYEERVRRPDGSFRDVQVTKVPVFTNNRQPVGILIVKMDITEFLAARDLAEEASRSKSEFVANISHELRTPLQSILGFSELGMLRGRQHEKLAAMFSDIHAAGQRMLVLVNDLLDIAKIESTVGAFHFERIDVRDLIDDVAAEMELLLGRKRLDLRLALGRAPLIAKVDPSRFQQVVRNVLANAVKFSPKGSAIDISASTPDDDFIHIQVCDQGPGIPPSELEAVFEAFVQSSQTRDGSGGTGLGLAICRKIITAHGGRINATNVPGGGAMFHIVLPTAGYTDTMPADPLMKWKMSVAPWRSKPALMYSVVACVFSALVLLGAWATMAALLTWQWQETLDAEMRQNTNTAQALKEHTLRVLDTVDQAMWRVQSAVRDRQLSGQDLVSIANETGMVPQILTQLSFVGADGRFQGSNLDPDGSRSQHVNLMDRDHIRVHLLPSQATPSPTGMLQNSLFVSRSLLGKVSGVRTIQISRKVIAEDGTTLGVVVASLNPDHFAEVYRGVDFGEDGGVALVGLDGIIRVRVLGGASANVDAQLPDDLLQTMSKTSRGATAAVSSDGIRRIIGFSRVGDYPLVVLSGTSETEAFAPWRTTRNTVLMLTVLLSLAVVAFVAVFLGSISRLALSHAALTQSEAEAQRANQAKSEFLAAMSHELRTPLTSIRGFAELMELRSKDPLIQEQSALIRQGAEHLNALLTEILDLARIEAGAMPAHPEPVVLHDLVHEVSELFRVSAVAKSLALTAAVSDAAPQTLVTDRLKLKQILSNLLSNAIKFTPAGRVEIFVDACPDGSQVHFHVNDTGPGIPASLHGVIFEKFSQGHARISYQHGGTGLGLSLSRALAELLGGTLTVRSAVGEGSTFTLSLPLHPPAQAAALPAQA